MDCKHPDIKIRFIDYASGRAFWESCQICGRKIRRLPKSEIERLTTPPVAYDESIERRWNDARQAEREAECKLRQVDYQAQREQERKKWFDWYNQYLLTPKWKKKRDEVLQRDSYLCQSCRSNRATEVHHLSYKHAGDEPLFELVSVCKSCHDRITEMDREK
jgi:hypothetical protein